MYMYVYECILLTICFSIGPLSHWCMCFEAKHNYFKSLAHRVKSFKNIPKTMASRHRKLICYNLSNGQLSPIIKGVKTSRCKWVTSSSHNAIHMHVGTTTTLKDYQHKPVLLEVISLDDSLSVSRYACYY